MHEMTNGHNISVVKHEGQTDIALYSVVQITTDNIYCIFFSTQHFPVDRVAVYVIFRALFLVTLHHTLSVNLHVS